MTIQAGNPGYFLATNSSCLEQGCSVMVSSWGAVAEPNQRWLYDDRFRIRPVSNTSVCLRFGAPNALVTLWGCDWYATNQKWNSVGEQP